MVNIVILMLGFYQLSCPSTSISYFYSHLSYECDKWPASFTDLSLVIEHGSSLLMCMVTIEPNESQGCECVGEKQTRMEDYCMYPETVCDVRGVALTLLKKSEREMGLCSSRPLLL